LLSQLINVVFGLESFLLAVDCRRNVLGVVLHSKPEDRCGCTVCTYVKGEENEKSNNERKKSCIDMIKELPYRNPAMGLAE
jgi:hypothetical protein